MALLTGDALYTTSAAVTLGLTLGDADTTGYQMKIWGVSGVVDEASAAWETYAQSKSITLPSGDGLKTVSVKVRDDVGNETAAVSDSITLDTAVPAVTITGPDRSKVSKVGGYDSAVISFTTDVAFEEYKVCVVPASNSIQSAGVVIPTAGGSANTSGSAGGYAADTNISVTIKGADLETASAGDGAYRISLFAQGEDGSWNDNDGFIPSGSAGTMLDADGLEFLCMR